MSTPQTPPAGWYDSDNGRQRWFDGTDWTDHYQGAPAPAAVAVQQPVQPAPKGAPMTSASLKVKREVSYVRPQKGHSLTKHLLLGWAVLYIPTIYYAASPNHYFHA